ncbi:MAG: bifunctional diaminohydroxyphosphoribosylaminopyrimidine deaminase/5-amino-6-(5-phosphoribosylamino)uracil reductase RibD [Deltaproteobacteria bacterium]|nr:bifunctional diaminohydroxyphosphoribosylaminopyrimidine deaminase/5-amino-6-(5-phosphoribosylamino)uracil reductase RibD [Deltaproteobacteria bacterium]
MRRAIELALKGLGQTSPNPIVGACIVKNGKVISEGYHKSAGLPHAEINALRKAKRKAQGADLYVSLEPCCHFGRTPPCTEAIIKAGIRRLIYGMKDPNPRIAGKGLKKLAAAGIKVIGPVLEKECRDINRPFIKWISTGRPYVTAKIAITLDGKIADFRGNSKWISNKRSLTYAHILRSFSDVIMVGAETYRKDKPRLNVRLPGYKGKQPVPIIVGGQKRKVNLKKLLPELGEAGFQSVLVEGGGVLQTELINAGLVDYLIVFIAPKLLGAEGKNWIGSLGKRSIKRSIIFNTERSFMLGCDIVIEGQCKPPPPVD